jgi:hypothetical protein
MSNGVFFRQKARFEGEPRYFLVPVFSKDPSTRPSAISTAEAKDRETSQRQILISAKKVRMKILGYSGPSGSFLASWGS